MPSTIFSGSKVKALKDRLSLNDVTEIISVSADPSVSGVAAPLGSIAMDYLAGKVYKKTGSANTEWQELGAGLGGINYIDNPDAESGTAGWATYNDGTAVPVDGSGGTPPAGLWVRSTTTPLRGSGDFNLVKTGAVSYQGAGVAYDFTIDRADLAKVLTVTFDYEVLSGTYASGDVAVYIIQDPAGTPVVIQPAGYVVQAGTVGTKLRQIATFQTASNVTSYRLCIHVASASTQDYTLALDTISVGPQVVQYGAPVTNTTSATPTWTNLGFSGTSQNSIVWWRAGKFLFARAYFNPSAGTGSASAFALTLPVGLSIDTTAIPGPESPASLGFYKVYDDAGGAATGIGTVDYDTTTTVAFRRSDSATFTTSAMTTADTFSCEFNVPILGWDSTVQMSNDTDTRVVAASYKKTATQAVTGNVTDITFQSSVVDTHGAFGGSTFIAPVPGIYDIGGVIGVTTGSVNIVAFVNGVSRTIIGTTISASNTALSGLVSLNAGDSLSIRSESSITVFGQASGLTSFFSIKRLSGPSAIAASETVAARFSTSSTQALTTTPSIINFATISYDTHGAVTTGASWKFTAPISGKYRVTSRLLSGVGTTIMRISYELFKTGVLQSTPVTGTQQTTSSGRIDGSGSDCIQLVAGDYIDLRGSCSTGSNSLAGDAATNFVVIERIGN
jgi:hypothetical protein